MFTRVMALSRCLIFNLCKQFNKLHIPNYNYFRSTKLLQENHPKLVDSQYNLNTWRFSSSFFSRTNAHQLWKGVTSVSNAGRRKGRGRALKRAKDLNKGQVIGVGKINMLWPGLNAPVVQGREVLRQQQLPPDEDRERRLAQIRKKLAARRSNKVHPLERGFSGTKLPGRSVGPPDPVNDETFEGFDSRVLQFITVSHMHGQRGRVRSSSAFVVVGNKKGLAGFGLAKHTNGATAAKRAKNRAAKVLRYINLDGNTVIHDFFCEFGASRIFVERRPEGFGLTCHRVLRCICEMIGIKDMYAKSEGATGSIQNLTKAFFIGLMRQKSLEQIAKEKQLHIVKLEKNRDNFPVVVASPDKCRTEKEISPTELLDFENHLHNGKVVEERKKFQPFYINFPSYIKEMKDREKLRNHRDVRIHLMSKYGALKSFVQVKAEEKAKQKLKDTVEEDS